MMRPLTKRPPFSAPSAFGTSATTLAERLASSTAGLMNMTLPVKVRPGTASVVNSSRWPTRTPDSCDVGTFTVRSSSRLSTMRNIGSAAAHVLDAVARIDAAQGDHAVHRGRDERLGEPGLAGAHLRARRPRSPASAASSADVASSSACGVIRPYCFSSTRPVVLALARGPRRRGPGPRPPSARRCPPRSPSCRAGRGARPSAPAPTR